jgi:probable O-glycosylation ligase (exosortase A-associated)
MRDLLLLSIIGVLVVRALVHPWIGIMAWTWVSIMNPHRYTWIASNLPVAAIVGAATLIGLVFTKDRRAFYLTSTQGALIAFMVWMSITLPFSIHPDESLPMWSRVMKIDFMILVALIVLQSRKQIVTLVWVLVGSIGFYGLKGGLFTIATGGSGRVWGPPGGFIEGNNELGLALIMTIPLMRFLQTQVHRIWQKYALTLLMMLSALAAIGTQSRGAFLALSSVGMLLILRSRQRLLLAPLVVLCGVGFLAFMPDSWHARMATIGTYTEDTSAMGRVNAWWMAYYLAKDRFFGSGFENVTQELFDQYAPYHDIRIEGPHSIYFEVLGQHGFVGLFLFLCMWVLVWRTARQTVRAARNIPEAKWCSDLAAMCQTSLLGYFVGGAFLGLAYYDLPYNILALVVASSRWVKMKEWLREGPLAGPLPEVIVPTSPVGGDNPATR